MSVCVSTQLPPQNIWPPEQPAPVEPPVELCDVEPPVASPLAVPLVGGAPLLVVAMPVVPGPVVPPEVEATVFADDAALVPSVVPPELAVVA
jgi:hypothetical protein